MPWALFAIGAGLWFVGRGVREAGEGVDAAGSGALKIAVVAGAGWYLAKKAGMLK